MSIAGTERRAEFCFTCTCSNYEKGCSTYLKHINGRKPCDTKAGGKVAVIQAVPQHLCRHVHT